MENISGIGGIFFKARDAKALGAWYRDNLGVQMMPGMEMSQILWREHEDPTKEGSTVWAVFPATTKYFAPSDASFMINYRVRDLDRMLEQLRAAGARIEGEVAEDDNGKFAWVVDPEGNKIELWQPKEGS
jgi:predicted enzyme related to lactoylglutathione lyase